MRKTWFPSLNDEHEDTQCTTAGGDADRVPARLGYTTATAIADIIDNSISAGARTVEVHVEWARSDSWIRITDDGCGMDDVELEQAMQLGASDPRHARRTDDLGRFGMGLKTASFSQARALTVHSRKAGCDAACLRWDLDVLEEISGGDWPMIEGPRPGSGERLGVEAMDGLGQWYSGKIWTGLSRLGSPAMTCSRFWTLWNVTWPWFSIA